MNGVHTTTSITSSSISHRKKKKKLFFSLFFLSSLFAVRSLSLVVIRCSSFVLFLFLSSLFAIRRSSSFVVTRSLLLLVFFCRSSFIISRFRMNKIVFLLKKKKKEKKRSQLNRTVDVIDLRVIFMIGLSFTTNDNRNRSWSLVDFSFSPLSLDRRCWCQQIALILFCSLLRRLVSTTSKNVCLIERIRWSKIEEKKNNSSDERR